MDLFSWLCIHASDWLMSLTCASLPDQDCQLVKATAHNKAYSAAPSGDQPGGASTPCLQIVPPKAGKPPHAILYPKKYQPYG